jgi:hypothetical protein
MAESPIVVIDGVRYKRAVADKLGLLKKDGSAKSSDTTARSSAPADKARTAGTSRTKVKGATTSSPVTSAALTGTDTSAGTPVGSEAGQAVDDADGADGDTE